MKTKLHFFFIFFTLSSSIFYAQTQKAKYSITFNSVWNSTDHGVLPGNAHWSKLVGVTHKSENNFWSFGAKATTGVKNIAETGNNTVFNTEVTTAITNLEADQYINGNSLGTATGDIIINDLIVDKDFPLVTLLTMIAPSPDWFVGVNSLKLTDDNANWKSSITVDLYAIDSGTDSGTNYTSNNLISNPFQNISSLKNVSPFNDKKIGTLTVSLTQTLNVEQFINDKSLSIFYNKEQDLIKVIDLENQIDDLKIYTIQGRLLNYNHQKNITNINLNNYSSGIYILKIKTKSGTYAKKILKH